MKVFAIACVGLLVASCAWAAPNVQDNKIESDSTFGRAARYLGACLESEDISTCLAVKGITALNRAARSNNIELANGVTFKRDPASPVQRSGKSLSEQDVYAELPPSTEERNSRLVDLAVSSVAEFLSTHNLEFKLPAETTQQVARALDEGRGKIKKMIGPLALAIGAKLFAVVPLVLGFLALLTFKAVVVAKIAFFLALLVGGSRLLGGFGKLGGSYGSGYNSNAWSAPASSGWSSGASSAYPYARSLSDADAQELAYAGQQQQQQQQQ
ncbi:uncharacterized protein LOC115621997 [Scaptodrosophila lebanonensis]|uniref:Uncharacterized protein LOC115621997 n=1 Tax=Drosophila lebanonensis TaxID=7225 RepID=A0A6J2T9T7_DROLE|nr:uncharacterized protein LOC115621997 [Scaptodrosophila lebanonensis]